MALYKPAELKAFLKELGISPQRHLSQNFLIDRNIRDKILNLAQIKSGDRVFEIGPGPGVLTEALIEKGAELLAVEKDRALAQALKRFDFHQLIESDILDLDLEKLCKDHKKDQDKISIISNLPYHLSSPILTRILPLELHVKSLTLMLQDEFAKRLLSPKDCKSYSSLTLFTQLYGTITQSFKVSKSCFYPIPKVDSRVIHIVLNTPPYPKEHCLSLTKFIHLCFRMRRKTIQTILKSNFPDQDISLILASIHMDKKLRPENLNLDDFWKLFQKIITKEHTKTQA
jgi:16S rRNA (adenine1518-N6/adenine1519-N6)-dimethyltransferase